jgi:cellulose synthase/poly-beta-1,6-N-acetylglucosamine synthase-like glycosyltransferase
LPQLLTLTGGEWFPFSGLPLAVQVLFSVAFVIILGMLFWTGLLFIRGLRADLHAPEPGGEDDFEWIFMVPALNEEVTIRDSVERLAGIELAHKRIVVINDGSDDGTGEVLGTLDSPDLHVIERTAPNARKGKAAALNFAFAAVGRLWPDLEPGRTIFCIVDADGRISPDSPSFVAGHFRDPRVGGVQSLVRIYNRHRLLTWFQDIEFSIYGRLFQAGRNGWGTPGMGGNGQYNRMSALASIDMSAGKPEMVPLDPRDEYSAIARRGPWRDRLTEDQDVGLRLIAPGWHMRQDNRARVDQQGLPKLRALLRQRTRWSQGNLQAMALIGPLTGSKVALSARIEAIIYLLTPFMQGIVGASLIVAIYLAITGTAVYEGSFWWLAFIYLLGFGGTLLGCIAAKMEGRFSLLGLIKGVLSAQVYAFYSWLLWPVLLRSAARQITGRGSWAKTAREKIPA